MERERKPFRGVKLFLMGYFLLLILVLTGIGIMNWLGYGIIDVSMEYALFGLLLCSALIAGAVWIVRRIQSKGIRIVVGALCTLVILALALAMMSAFSLILVARTPLQYTQLTSPEGRTVVVLRQMSVNGDRIVERLEARGAGQDADAAKFEDLGYSYSAHPRVAHFFYNRKIQATGALEIGCASDAQLMYEWPEENVLYLYVDAPQPGDGGELTLELE